MGALLFVYMVHTWHNFLTVLLEELLKIFLLIKINDNKKN